MDKLSCSIEPFLLVLVLFIKFSLFIDILLWNFLRKWEIDSGLALYRQPPILSIYKYPSISQLHRITT